jgi:glycosyltransferase involved in cell wall biosynthesis
MCTYNRGHLLAGAMRSILAQRASAPFELIVVDNNSTDGTRDIVVQLAAADPRVRYVAEAQQGLSHARNAGIGAARAPIVALIDDDVRAEPAWLEAVLRAFDEYGSVDVVGGRVLPVWPAPPPRWLTPDHWAPLALVDYGDAPLWISPDRPLCLVGANLSVRRSTLDRVGPFATDLQRVRDRIGSLEDHEFLLRVLRRGGKALYDPRIIVAAAIQPDRLEHRYHRRWHAGHGHFHALLRSEHMERTGAGTLFGVPAHLYRQAIADAYGWVRAAATGQAGRAFSHEMRLRFFGGFFHTRRREFRARPRAVRRAELLGLLRTSIRRVAGVPARASRGVTAE